VTSSGIEAVELARSAGLNPDPWQAYAVDVILAERRDGKWAAFEAALLVARQNGKGGILEILELAGLFLLGERLILHSAHEFKTSQEAFLRIKDLIDNCDELRRRVARVRTSHGDEGIELLTGQRLRFVARSRSSGRGFSGDRVILDEAQELPRSAMGALLPTLSARPNPQVIYAGTVPSPSNDSEHFETVRDRGRRGDDPSLAWLEWSPEPTGPDDSYDLVDLDDEANWAAANPALGYRITAETIARERNALGSDEFARERLSIWHASASVTTAIDMTEWASLKGLEEQRPSPVAFAVVASPDRRWSTIAVAGLRTDERRQLQIVQTGRGTDWVVARLVELFAEWKPVAVAVSPDDPIASLIPDLAAAKIRLLTVSTREMAQGCGMVVDGVTAGTVRHCAQPVLDVALSAACKRRTGEQWVWAAPAGGKVDISPLKAVTLALYALTSKQKSKRTPARVVVMR
jgi:hypothetical protein